MKPLFATAVTALTVTAALSAAEAKVRLAEVTLERSATQSGRAPADLRIVQQAGKLTFASTVDQLRLALGVEMRGGGNVRRVILVLPRGLGGTRQILFESKTGGPSVQVDFRLRAGDALRDFVAAKGLAACRAGNGATVAVDIPIGLAIDARNGSRRVFRLRRSVSLVVACPIAGATVDVRDKLGSGTPAASPRNGDAPQPKAPPVTAPRDPAVDDTEQRSRAVTPKAAQTPPDPPAAEQSRQLVAASS
jgi:hypothetical protein